MTTDFGSDVYSVDDVDETRTVSGVALVAQDAFWRLQTPRGMGILAADSPDYGVDLLDAIGSVANDTDAASIPGIISVELRKDPRIDTVEAKVIRTVNGPGVEYDISIRCETSEGPFSLVGTAGSDGLDLAIKLLPEGVQ